MLLNGCPIKLSSSATSGTAILEPGISFEFVTRNVRTLMQVGQQLWSMGEPVLKSSAFGFPIGVTKIPVSLSSLTEVDVNGLPRLPLSVTCYARFRQLSHIRHPNLCRYLDAVREKGEIISVISEYYSTSFYDLSDPVTNVNWLLNRFYECLSALAFMNDNGLVHSCLTPEMIMLDPDGHVK
ncbi:unnamed protein product [Heterobilharzia americana]|nr:unnamed protein product [Heterobilharzia americana]